MLNREQEMCIKLMITENKTQKQIAKELKITEQTICNWKKDKEFKEEIQKQMQENFGILAIEAQQKLKKLLNSKNEYIQIQAIKDILDRAGYKPTDKTEISGSIENSSNLILESINRQLCGGNNGTK